nr:MAG TPA: Ski oncogene helix, forkhead, ONCOPROTEIN.65A [Caudoviricetes sp.]
MQLAFVVEGEPFLRLGDDFVRQPCRICTPNQLDGLIAVKNGV